MKNLKIFSLLFLILASCTGPKQPIRQTLLLDPDWSFLRDSVPGAENPRFDDSGWRKVDLPHDYSIEDLPGTNSPFNPDALGGVSTGFTTGGTAWYRKTLEIPKGAEGQSVILLFEGIYMNADIYLNGNLLGNHPYGYTSFWYDISDKLDYNGKNILAVKVKNEGQNSRWYSGSGIYRHVRLRITGRQHVPQYGTCITTPEVSADSALVVIKTTVENEAESEARVQIVTQILDPEGIEIRTNSDVQTIGPEAGSGIANRFNLDQPLLWSVDSPSLYTAVTKVYTDNLLTDSTATKFGIRSISFTTDGFKLNGVAMKLRGGCFHHDNGPLGARSFDRAEERKAEVLKASGFNAVRCSHNPPSPAFLDACDRVGLLVMDEAFDMWAEPKNPQDYHLWFSEWWKRDIESMILRDRNHPSVIMWSIGNEIPNRHTPAVAELSKKLGDYVRELDPTRPVTSAVNDLKPDKDPFFATLDVAGYNYAAAGGPENGSVYKKDHARIPERIMVGTESFPLEAFGAWMTVEDNPWIIGDFVWTAVDYIGEASIGWRGYPQEKNFFPWNLAWCGDIDICGWKRPQSYYRDVLWERNRLSVFVKPPKPSFDPNPARAEWSKWHWDDVVADWNWQGNEGQPLEVSVYSSCDEAGLFLNGKPLGRKKTDRSTEFRATWKVPYEAGELMAVGYTGGREVNYSFLKTSGPAAKLAIFADRDTINANGQDLSYITVFVGDQKLQLDPKAENLVSFEVEGAGTLAAVGNANPVSTESYIATQRKTWRGKCLLIVKAGTVPGEMKVTAKAAGLEPATLSITCR